MRLALGIAAAAGLAASPAAADLTHAAKVACVVDQVTRCTAPGACTTRPPTADERARVLEIDFAARSAAMRGSGRKEADVSDDRIEGGVRRATLQVIGRGRPVAHIALTAAGKLTITMASGSGHREEATCTAS